jgi:hypothetical protein
MDYVNDSMMFEDSAYKPDINSIIMDSRNPGGAIDLGFKYVFNNKLNLYGSLLDLGFIRYKNNVTGVKASGEFKFDGWDIQPYFNTTNDSVAQEHANQFKDSVIKIFEPQLTKKAYSYWLAPKMYLGGTYTFTDKFNVGLLFRGDFFLKRLHGGVTLSGNANLAKWFMGTVSYTVENNSFKQIGAGILLKMAFFQFYVVTDNVCGFIWPDAARNFNIRLGINMLFGCNKKNAKTLVD